MQKHWRPLAQGTPPRDPRYDDGDDVMPGWIDNDARQPMRHRRARLGSLDRLAGGKRRRLPVDRTPLQRQTGPTAPDFLLLGRTQERPWRCRPLQVLRSQWRPGSNFFTCVCVALLCVPGFAVCGHAIRSSDACCHNQNAGLDET
jgi:hypothetical protein